MKNPVVHFEMPAKDKDRVKKFYENVFGWKMIQTGPEMGNYIMAQTTTTDDTGMPVSPGAINGGFFESSDEVNKPSVVISVPNLEESMADVVKSGGKIFGVPMEIPHVGKFCAFEDSEGNRVGMLEPFE